jgi:hypothetical protein
MSQAKLYLDEDAMRTSLVFGLRARNVEVMTADEARMINRADQDHLEFATTSGRVRYSFNVGDYCVLHQDWIAQRRSHAGIIIAPQQRYSVGEELRRFMRFLSSVTAEDMRRRIEFGRAYFSRSR